MVNAISNRSDESPSMIPHAARLLVTGSSTFFSGRLIHDLGRCGATVTAADSLRFSAGKASRYTSRRVLMPAVGADPGRYLETLIKELKQVPYDLLLPTFEEALLLSEYQSDLLPYVRLFLPNFEMMYRLHHKPSLHEFCLAHELPTPPTVVSDRIEQLIAAAHRMRFPVVLKLPGGNNSVGRTFCNNESELMSTWNQLAETQRRVGGELPFVQKKIRGNLICTLCFCSQGTKLAEVVYRTLRMFPQAGGTTVHRQSIVHDEISRIADRVVAATRWSGFLGFDFLVDEDSGIPYLIDANVRANPAINLGFSADLDWTRMILDLAQDRIPEIQTAKPGINVHTLLMDFVWLLEGLLPRAGGLRLFPQRCRDFISPPWHVHSRGDMLATGEWAPVAILGAQTVYSGLKSLVTGRQPGQILLEHANYDAVAAERYRQTRRPVLPERIAA